MSQSTYAKIRLADEFLRQEAAQKRRFTIIMSVIISLAAALQAFLRLENGLRIAAVFSLLMGVAGLVTLVLAVLRRQNTASHTILTAGLIGTAANQYATGSANIGPIAGAFTILAGALYLLSSRWGLFYGLLAFARVFTIKVLAQTGIIAAAPIAPSVLEWYAGLIPGGTVFFFVTIAAKRNTEKLLRLYRDAAETRTRFLSRMSHEIRTPLNGILGLSQVLAEQAREGEQKEFLKIIIRSGQHLLYVVNRILEISRVEHKAHSEREPYDPVVLLEQVADFVRADIRQKGISLTLSVQPGVPEILHGDVGGIRQILANLLSNAVKYTERGSISLDIAVDAALPPREIIFSVSDTGRGISPEKRAEVFEAFEQGNFSTPVDRGVGLGLTICRELCEAMGGSVALQSELGKGSTFTVRLPIVHTGAGGTEQVTQNVSPRRGISVLYVEDDEVNRILMESMLATEDLQLHTAADGNAGMAEFSRHQFDVVLTDIHMPEMDGYAFLDAVRQYEASQGRQPVPVIAVSANVIPEEIQRALLHGFSAYVEKPFSREKLLTTMAGVAGGRA